MYKGDKRTLGLALLAGVICAALVGLWNWTPPFQEALVGSLVNKVILLDPGHGGPDPGSVGPEGTLEKDVVLSIGLKLRAYFLQAGATVVMTRMEDRDLSGLEYGSLRERKVRDLHARARLINETAPDVAISIHANAFPSPRWYGAQTFYNSKTAWAAQSRFLAEMIQEELRRQTRNTNRWVSDQVDQYILEQARVPIVNVEVGFLSNPREEQLLNTEAYQRRLAWAIFLGTARYFVAAAVPAATNPAPPSTYCLTVWSVTGAASTQAAAQPNPLIALVPQRLCTRMVQVDR
mgnify:CR=1 FL=1